MPIGIYTMLIVLSDAKPHGVETSDALLSSRVEAHRGFQKGDKCSLVMPVRFFVTVI